MSSVPLRKAMRSFLENWRNDITPAWRGVLEGVEPAFDQVRDDLVLRDGETIFPGRRGSPLDDAPAGAHLFKALDRLHPDSVKAMVIGQDPYPRVSRATGRAFDQGDLSGWAGAGNVVTTSMKRLLQAVAHYRTADIGYVEAGGWQKVQKDLEAGTLNFLAPSAQFAAWEDAGVLWLNAGLTLSHYEQGGAPEQKFGHIPLWRPIVNQIIRHLARRAGQPVVFLTWGGFARDVLTSSGVKNEPTWGVSASVANNDHPATEAFFDPNPLADANRVLSELGGLPIPW